ncbi:efflux RND transporter periplasmic adaptor subunit [Rhodoferax sp.]|uniref:efflux RND transporter periplasmic adaptor subunit n=1 Tax=Rhodoferax sp. TaxID=50421 RepID=UPI00271DF116|nr:HlyD family efflux transporter periplasmic adaptor subunit [Rhodoferax sp.]MDO9198829.1 HlyD family efflux transporter periplasmic adaptor subunit [Rhodoferax sp.]
MKRKIWIGIVSLLALALLGWAFMPTPAEVEIATVTQGRFERSVQEDGKTRLRDRYVVSAPLAGRVARILLKQGDTVVRDAAVATFWPVAPALLDERTRAEQSARIGAMQASVARAQANAERAGAALDQARADLKRSEALAQQGFVSPNQNETGRLNVRLREKELESARQEEVATRHELEQSRVALRQFSQSPRDGLQRTYEVRAPVSGKVLKVLQQSEGIVMAGTPIMELGDPRQLEVVVDILTEEAAQIKPGTAVQLSNWGGPDVLEGQVRLIEPAAFTKVSALGVEEQRVNAVIDITSPPEKWHTLGDGFKVDVRVLVQVVENAVKIPVSALFPVGARSGLFVLANGRARLQEIEVTARNGVEAWVKSGLTKDTQVIVYPDTKLKDGDRVKAR